MTKCPALSAYLALALLSGLLASCDTRTAPPPEPAAAAQAVERTETQKMHAFMDEVYERNVAAWPEWETQLGRKTDRQGQWNDYSDHYAESRPDVARNDLRYLREHFDYASLDDNGKLSYDLFVYNVEQALDDAAWRRHDYVVDQFNGQVSDRFAFLQNFHAIENEQDAEDYVERVAGLREVFEELARQLRDRSDFGVATPAFAYDDILADVGSMTSGAPITDKERVNPLLEDFRSKLDGLQLGAEGYAQIEGAAIAALRGPFREGADALMAELRYQQARMQDSLGVWSLPDGEAYYRNRIRHHTTLDLTAEEIHRAGLEDVARIHEEMRAIMQAVGFDGSLQAFFEFVRTDPNIVHRYY